MSVRKRKGRQGWLYDFSITVAGKVVFRERRDGFVTKRDAQLAEAEARAKHAADGPRPTATTFKALAQEVLVLHAAVENKDTEQDSKESIFRVHLVPAFGDLDLEQIDERAIAAYKSSKLQPKPEREGEDAPKGLSPKTVNNHLTVLLTSLKLAKRWKKLRVVPEVGFLRVPKPEIDFLTFEEAPRLLAGADPEWRTMILLGLRAGLRQGEILALRWDDVDLVRGVLHVTKRVYKARVDTPKGGRRRDVPMGDELREALRALPSRFAGGLVFPAMDRGEDGDDVEAVGERGRLGDRGVPRGRVGGAEGGDGLGPGRLRDAGVLPRRGLLEGADEADRDRRRERTGRTCGQEIARGVDRGEGPRLPLRAGDVAARQRHLRKNECKWPLWRACKRAGLRRVGWHVLRHTFASHLVMRGAPLKAVQELLGHATIEMTMRYAHLAPDVSREAVKLLDEPKGEAKKKGETG
jgi:integrase